MDATGTGRTPCSRRGSQVGAGAAETRAFAGRISYLTAFHCQGQGGTTASAYQAATFDCAKLQPSGGL